MAPFHAFYVRVSTSDTFVCCLRAREGGGEEKRKIKLLLSRKERTKEGKEERNAHPGKSPFALSTAVKPRGGESSFVNRFANRFFEERRKAACNRAFNNNNEAIKPRPCPYSRVQKGNEAVVTEACQATKISTRIPDARVAN